MLKHNNRLHDWTLGCFHACFVISILESFASEISEQSSALFHRSVGDYFIIVVWTSVESPDFNRMKNKTNNWEFIQRSDSVNCVIYSPVSSPAVNKGSKKKKEKKFVKTLVSVFEFVCFISVQVKAESRAQTNRRERKKKERIVKSNKKTRRAEKRSFFSGWILPFWRFSCWVEVVWKAVDFEKQQKWCLEIKWLVVVSAVICRVKWSSKEGKFEWLVPITLVAIS